MFSLVLAGVLVLYGAQLSRGTYLGCDWAFAAVAGMVTALGLIAAVWVSNRRHHPLAFSLNMTVLVLASISASAIRIPFPQGPYGDVESLFNVAHAAMLGFDAVVGTAILAVVAYAVLRPGSRTRPP